MNIKICLNSPIAYYLRDAIRHRKNREQLNFGCAIKTGNFITMYVEAYMCGCDMKEALEAVRLMQPRMVIPVHYNCAFLGQRNINPTDDEMFKREMEKMGIECSIMKYGDEMEV